MVIPEDIKFRRPWDEERNAIEGKAAAIDFTGDPGKTLQEPAEEADINVLMKRMGVKDGSILPRFSSARALYGDYSEFPEDPTELANMMREGELAFKRLPADLRERYGTPDKLFKFMQRDENYDEAVKLGLLEKKKPPVKSDIDRLVDKMDTFVSSSTSSVKEPLVPTSQQEKK